MRRTKESPGIVLKEKPAAESSGLPRHLSDGRFPSVEAHSAREQLLWSLQQANERCIEMLVQAARSDRKDTFPLVSHLRDLFRSLTPEVRARAARARFLLVDLELSNAEWWTDLQAHPARAASLFPGRGCFPRAGAIQLGRAALVLAWHSVRSEPAGSYLLGVSSEVARILTTFSLTELDRMVERRFRHLRPRWDDRPAVWRALLENAQALDARRTRETNLWMLQLMTADLLLSPLSLH